MDDLPALSRRRFLSGPIRREPFRSLPPWVTPSGADACTGCGDCVAGCPTGIISLSDSGLRLGFTPGECTFCGTCAAICPEPAVDLAQLPPFPCGRASGREGMIQHVE